MKKGNPFWNQESIRYKLAAFTFLVIVGALLLTFLLNTSLNYLSTHIESVKRVESVNNYIVESIRHFHSDHDQAHIHDIEIFFESLHLEPFIEKVCYYHDDILTGSYINKKNINGRLRLCPTHHNIENFESLNVSFMHVSKLRDVYDLGGRKLGQLYVLYDKNHNLNVLIRETLIGLFIILIVGVFVCIFTYKNQGFLINPITHLSNLAVSMATQPDYSRRAKKYSNDELGQLSDSFNIMIAGMEKQYQELQKINSQATEATKQKSAFLAMMSHEIRTPINGIIGTVELLSETHLTGRQKEYVHIIDKSAETLLGLINDVLDYSKIEAEKLTIEKIPFDLTQHVQDVIDMLQVNIKQEGLSLFFKNSLSSHSMMLEGDPVRVKQILINFVTNAIKFTEEGSITVELMEGDDTGGDTKNITLSVSDTGIGIPKDRQESIFESFSQADDSTTRKYGGSGLGLTICRRLVERMDGKIGVESEVGMGSTFWATIPMRVISPDEMAFEAQKDSEREDVILPAIEDNRILFVEDNETNIMITSEILRQAGYDVILCYNGEEAVLAYQNEPVPLILMDCQMPVMDGWEATRRIREYERNNSLFRSRIIALTANAMDGDRERCIEAEMDDYLAKPFKKRALLEKLGNIIKK